MDKEQVELASQSRTVSRQELLERIAQKVSISQELPAKVLEATLESIQEALQNGDEARFLELRSAGKVLRLTIDNLKPSSGTLLERVGYEDPAGNAHIPPPPGYKDPAGNAHIPPPSE